MLAARAIKKLGFTCRDEIPGSMTGIPVITNWMNLLRYHSVKDVMGECIWL
jgi:hypothetical protein